MYIESDEFDLRRLYVKSGIVWTSFERNGFWTILTVQAFLAALTLRGRAVAFITFITLLIAIVFGIVIADTSLVKLPLSAKGMWLAAVGLGTAFGCLLSASGVFRAELDARKLAFLLIVLFLPFVYAFGTSNLLWEMLPYASIFWIVASVLVVGRCCTRSEAMNILAVLSTAVVGTTALLVAIGVEHPHRQPALRAQHSAVIVGEGILNLHETSAEYIRVLRNAVASIGFTPGTPVIDLTGRHPGTVFTLNASAPGLPWLLSGYIGSTTFAMAGLELASCGVLARSWLLFSSTDQIRMWFPDVILSRFGFNIQRDYVEVARATPPTGFGEQMLLRPAMSPERATNICEFARTRSTINAPAIRVTTSTKELVDLPSNGFVDDVGLEDNGWILVLSGWIAPPTASWSKSVDEIVIGLGLPIESAEISQDVSTGRGSTSGFELFLGLHYSSAAS